MRIIVCGGRDYGVFPPNLMRMSDQELEATILRVNAEVELVTTVLDIVGPTEIGQGGAKGADALALKYALDHGVKYRTYFADWERWGNVAGPKRNRLMYELFGPQLVVGFPGGRGTANMLGLSQAHNTPTAAVTLETPLDQLREFIQRLRESMAPPHEASFKKGTP